MSNPLVLFGKQYFKLPDCWRSLTVFLGFLFLDKLYVDRSVRKHIFGDDGKGGEFLLCQARIDHHEAEYREARKQWYWHQRKAKFYMPQDFTFNDKLDYKTLSYNYAHFNSYLDPKTVPGHHDPDGYYFNDLERGDYCKE